MEVIWWKMGFLFKLINSSIIFATWLSASVKTVFIFCMIVMVRICTPRFGLGAITRLSWGSLLMYIIVFFIFYVAGVM